jgi:hypothetical protein
MATIKDVAALAGISYTTVSHVLNKTRPVSEHVRLKVEAAIAELDYVPSAVARSLKARSTATIGLLVPNSVNPYFAELARGIEDACERNGYCVILCNSDDNPQKQRSYLRVLLEKRIDGLVVASVGEDDDLLQSLAGVRTPMVIVDRAGRRRCRPGAHRPRAAYLATRHLLELGHRDIATIGGPADTGVSQLRLAASAVPWPKPAAPVPAAMCCTATSPARGPCRGGAGAGRQAALGDLRRQRHDRLWCAARCRRTQYQRTRRAVGDRLRRHRTEPRVPGADHRRPVDPRAGRARAALLLTRIATPRAVGRRSSASSPAHRRVNPPGRARTCSTTLLRNAMNAKVVVVGSLNMDLVARAQRLPRAGETLPGDSFFTVPGGKGANQAVAVARLGASVAMVGNVGDDAYGQQLRKALEVEGIDCQGVSICPGTSSGVALIVVDAASQNAIVIIAGANGLLTPESVQRFDALLQQAEVIICQLEVPAPTVAWTLARARAGQDRDPQPGAATARCRLTGTPISTT